MAASWNKTWSDDGRIISGRLIQAMPMLGNNVNDSGNVANIARCRRRLTSTDCNALHFYAHAWTASKQRVPNVLLFCRTVKWPNIRPWKWWDTCTLTVSKWSSLTTDAFSLICRQTIQTIHKIRFHNVVNTNLEAGCVQLKAIFMEVMEDINAESIF